MLQKSLLSCIKVLKLEKFLHVRKNFINSVQSLHVFLSLFGVKYDSFAFAHEFSFLSFYLTLLEISCLLVSFA